MSENIIGLAEAMYAAAYRAGQLEAGRRVDHDAAKADADDARQALLLAIARLLRENTAQRYIVRAAMSRYSVVSVERGLEHVWGSDASLRARWMNDKDRYMVSHLISLADEVPADPSDKALDEIIKMARIFRSEDEAKAGEGV